MFHLNHPDRRQQIFIKNVSLHFSIHPSFSNVSCSSATAQHHDFPTSKFHLQTSQLVWCFWGDMCCLFSTKHSVYYGIQRVQFLFNLTRLYPPILLQACPNVVQQTEKAHATCFFFSNGILCHECAYRPLFSLTQLYLQIFSLLCVKSCGEHLVVAGLWRNCVLSTSGLWLQQCSLEPSVV